MSGVGRGHCWVTLRIVARRSCPPIPRTAPRAGENWAQPPINAFEGKSVGLALSGGGYRAAAFAAGAIAALVDGDVWKEVRWVSSTSGGSFANIAAARLLPDDGGPEAATHFLTEVRRSLRRPFGLLRGWRRATSSVRPPTSVAEWYEASIASAWLRGERGIRLGELPPRNRTHVLVALDLAGLSPVYLSNHSVSGTGLDGDDHFEVNPGALPAASAVAAAVSFPGLPAVRIDPEDLGRGMPPDFSLYLSDAGVWNNLATDWEHQAFLLNRDWTGIKHLPREVDHLLVVDASAMPSRPKRRSLGRSPISLTRPGISGFRSLRASTYGALGAARRGLVSSPSLDMNEDRGRPGLVQSPAIRVSILDTPRDVRWLPSHVGWADPSEWAAVRDHTRSLGTAWPTVRGLKRRDVDHLFAHGYAVCSAHLVEKGCPTERFKLAYDRPGVRSMLPR